MKHIMVIVCLAILLVIAGMPIATASPTISGISPSSGPNNMDVQIIVHGTGFNTSTSTVWLKMCPNEKNAVGEHPLYPSSYSVDSSTQITATFPLSGRDVGWYDVHVEQPGSAKDMNLPIVAYIYPIAFQVYAATGSGPSYSTTDTPGTTATTVPTYSTPSSGDNSVFFETDPAGAEIWLDGDDVGTSTFTYHTDRDGTYDVVAKMAGYEDYDAKVTIIRGQRVSFYAPLTLLSCSSSNATSTTTATTATTAVSGTPVKTVTTIQKSTLKIPTPWGTDPPTTEESLPVDPAVVFGATSIAIGIVLLRRR